MNDYSEMPDRLSCPVCRAGQEPSLVCRRCGADLDLYLACLSSRLLAERKHREAKENCDNSTTQRMEEYLTWLVGRPSKALLESAEAQPGLADKSQLDANSD